MAGIGLGHSSKTTHHSILYYKFLSPLCFLYGNKCLGLTETETKSVRTSYGGVSAMPCVPVAGHNVFGSIYISEHCLVDFRLS